MCQNWYSVIGQLLDVIGFLTIAFEWYHQYKRDHEKRIGELHTASETKSAEYRGEKYEDPDNDADNWRIFQKLFLEEWRWRRKVFVTGVGLVILGFVFQVLGNWPHLFRAC
jgi:hypothetical protein